MKISAEKLCDEIAASIVSSESRGEQSGGRGRASDGEVGQTYMSSRGEMKISLSEMT